MQSEFWTADRIARVRADMERGHAVLAARRWSPRGEWLDVPPSMSFVQRRTIDRLRQPAAVR